MAYTSPFGFASMGFVRQCGVGRVPCTQPALKPMFDGLEPIEPIAIGFFPSTDWLLSFSPPELKKPSPPDVEISAELSNEAKKSTLL